MSLAANPLLDPSFPVPFGSISAEHVVPGIREALDNAQAAVDEIARSPEGPNWENTFVALDAATSLLQRRIAPVTHLVAVAESAGYREAYNTILPEITAFFTDLFLRDDLWARVSSFASDELEAGYQRRHVERTANAFRRAGAQLSPRRKARLKKLHIELARMEQRFAENVLDATAAFELVVTQEGRVAGVPDDALRRARERASSKGVEGWAFGLDQPSVEAVLKHARDRSLRREIFLAYVGRCRHGEYSNVALVARILRTRDEIAHTLGYNNYADYQLEERMARSSSRAVEFEEDLVRRSRAHWRRDLEQLQRRARSEDIDTLEPWDAAFIIEALRREEHDLDAELLRPYLPLSRVLAGLFEIVERVFGFSIERHPNDDVWHPDVEYYRVRDATGEFVGAFYADWFPRPEKRQGAWMCDLVTGGPAADGGFAPHLGAVCANFAPPDGEAPALLRHSDARTVFHEFGHLLHHLASRVEIPSRAGINVVWDWVELPSQLLENWAWEKEACRFFSGHFESGEPLPEELFDRLARTRSFMGGWTMMRQLSFGWTDLALHTEMATGMRAIEAGLLEARGADAPSLTSEGNHGSIPKGNDSTPEGNRARTERGDGNGTQGGEGSRDGIRTEGDEGNRTEGSEDSGGRAGRAGPDRDRRTVTGDAILDRFEATGDADLDRGEAAGDAVLDRGEAVMAFARECFGKFAPEPFARHHPMASFLHIFSGGYAAGYYSYMWSAVLDADAFSRFQTNGIFNREVGQHFVDAILSKGDSAHPGLLFQDFMGRPPDATALLERELGEPLSDNAHTREER